MPTKVHPLYPFGGVNFAALPRTVNSPGLPLRSHTGGAAACGGKAASASTG
jgi:hypothetical protein